MNTWTPTVHTIAKTKATPRRPFPYKICQICSKTFPNKSNLNQHRKIHFPPQFIFDFCLKMFTFKCNRDAHMNTGVKTVPVGASSFNIAWNIQPHNIYIFCYSIWLTRNASYILCMVSFSLQQCVWPLSTYNLTDSFMLLLVLSWYVKSCINLPVQWVTPVLHTFIRPLDLDIF